MSDISVDPTIIRGTSISWKLTTGPVMGLKKFGRAIEIVGAADTNTIGTSRRAQINVVTEFLIQNQSGVEVAFQSDQLDEVVLRDGHQVTAVSARGLGGWCWVALVNHDTRQWFVVKETNVILRRLGLVGGSKWWLFLPLLCFGIYALLTYFTSEAKWDAVIGASALIAGLLGIVATLVFHSRRQTTIWNNYLCKELEAIAGKLLNSSHQGANAPRPPV